MELIRSYEELNSCVRAFKKSHKNCLANFYVLGNAIKGQIARGVVCVHAEEGSVIIKASEGTHAYLYVLVDREADLPKLQYPEPSLIRVVYNKVSNLTDIEAFKEKIEKAGFRFEIKSLQTGFLFKEKQQEIKAYFEKYSGRFNSDELYFSFAGKDDFQRVLKLWKETFPFYRIPAYTDEEIADFVENKKIYLVKNKETDEIAAATMAEMNGKIAEQVRIFASANYRRQSLGSYIFFYMLNDCMEKGARVFNTWIDEPNEKSWKFHGRICTLTGIVSDQYICYPGQ